MPQDLPTIRLFIPLEKVATIFADVGSGPDAEELATAPFIDTWQPILTPTDEICLNGLVTGHPILGVAPRWVATSQVILLDQSAGWCRTASRVYRLGRLSEVRGLDMPPKVRFSTWARPLAIEHLGPLLGQIAFAVHLAFGPD